ncbi:MAG: hypothetical protein ABGY08_04540 [Gammaproteobacteria bacterium]
MSNRGLIKYANKNLGEDGALIYEGTADVMNDIDAGRWLELV